MKTAWSVLVAGSCMVTAILFSLLVVEAKDCYHFCSRLTAFLLMTYAASFVCSEIANGEHDI